MNKVSNIVDMQAGTSKDRSVHRAELGKALQ